MHKCEILLSNAKGLYECVIIGLGMRKHFFLMTPVSITFKSLAVNIFERFATVVAVLFEIEVKLPVDEIRWLGSHPLWR
jgi:hypothetical protein